MSLSSDLNAIVKHLQEGKVMLAAATEHVQYGSDEYAQILLWQSDLEFVELLIGMWMYDHGIERDRGTSTKHIKRKITSHHIPESLLNEEWIGGTHDKTPH